MGVVLCGRFLSRLDGSHKAHSMDGKMEER